MRSSRVANELNEGENQPALLGRIKPIAAIVFGAIAMSTILEIIYEFLNVATGQ